MSAETFRAAPGALLPDLSPREEVVLLARTLFREGFDDHADIALLANHGVFVLAGSIRAAHQRSVAIEQRCRHAWLTEVAGGGRPLPEAARAFFGRSNGEGFIGFWEAMARAELRRDPALLQSRRASS